MPEAAPSREQMIRDLQGSSPQGAMPSREQMLKDLQGQQGPSSPQFGQAQAEQPQGGFMQNYVNPALSAAGKIIDAPAVPVRAAISEAQKGNWGNIAPAFMNAAGTREPENEASTHDIADKAGFPKWSEPVLGAAMNPLTYVNPSSVLGAGKELISSPVEFGKDAIGSIKGLLSSAPEAEQAAGGVAKVFDPFTKTFVDSSPKVALSARASRMDPFTKQPMAPAAIQAPANSGGLIIEHMANPLEELNAAKSASQAPPVTPVTTAEGAKSSVVGELAKSGVRLGLGTLGHGGRIAGEVLTNPATIALAKKAGKGGAYILQNIPQQVYQGGLIAGKNYLTDGSK